MRVLEIQADGAAASCEKIHPYRRSRHEVHIGSWRRNLAVGKQHTSIQFKVGRETPRAGEIPFDDKGIEPSTECGLGTRREGKPGGQKEAGRTGKGRRTSGGHVKGDPLR